MMQKKLDPVLRLKCALFAASVVLSPVAIAESPWVSGPSAIVLGENAVMRGGSLPPNESVAVLVTPPSGVPYRHAVSVDSQGTFEYQVPIVGTGVYTIEVQNHEGRALASANFNAGE